MNGDEILNRRKEIGASRNRLADEANIRPGRLWAIEHGKGNPISTDEETALNEAIARLAIDKPPIQKSTTKRVPKPPARSVTTVQVTDRPRVSSLTRAGIGINWSSLMLYADSVSPHDIEKAVDGPNPNAGYRLFSNSEIRTFLGCRRKWWLAYHRGLKSKYESPLGALAIGARVHRALQRYYVPEMYQAIDPREAIETLIREDWARVERATTGTNPELLDAMHQLKTKFDAEADLERIMLDGYVEWLADTGADEDFEVIAVEGYQEAELELPGDYANTKIIGKLDVIARRHSNGSRIFLDHKTVANFTQPSAILAFNPQMLHYHLILSLTTEGDEYCEGALYNMLRKVKRSSTARPPFFMRVSTPHNSHEIANYRRQVSSIITAIRDTETELARLEVHPNSKGYNAHHDIVYPSPTYQCSWSCPFYKACNTFNDGSRAEDMLSEHYITHDVFDYYYENEMNEGENAAV